MTTALDRTEVSRTIVGVGLFNLGPPCHPAGIVDPSLTERTERSVALKIRGGCEAGALRSVAHQTEEAVSRWMRNVAPSLPKPTYSPARNELFSMSMKVIV